MKLRPLLRRVLLRSPDKVCGYSSAVELLPSKQIVVGSIPTARSKIMVMKMSTQIEVISFTENEDGSANVVFELDKKSVEIFVKIGLLKVLTDEANRVLDQEHETSIDDNVGC
jgi:hypothetical protein